MNLCIDIGNTSCKVGIFEKRKLLSTMRFTSEYIEPISLLFRAYPITNSIVCSTRNLDKELMPLLESNSNSTHLTHDAELPIKIRYHTPDTLGRDRIAAVIGAYMPKGNKNHLIIDAGTCITYDIVDKEGNYEGGNIAPGIQMRITAMHDYTAKLPMVDLVYNEDWIGKTTESALQNGAVHGTIMEIESFISKVKSVYKRINITLTGGNAEFLADKLKTKIFVSPNLVLIGLNELLLFRSSKL